MCVGRCEKCHEEGQTPPSPNGVNLRSRASPYFCRPPGRTCREGPEHFGSTPLTFRGSRRPGVSLPSRACPAFMSPRRELDPKPCGRHHCEFLAGRPKPCDRRVSSALGFAPRRITDPQRHQNGASRRSAPPLKLETQGKTEERARRNL